MTGGESPHGLLLAGPGFFQARFQNDGFHSGICLLSDGAYNLPFEFYKWNQGEALTLWTEGLQVGFSSGFLCSTVNTLYSQVDLSARGPTLGCLERKTNLYFVERAYCSQGVVVANFSGSLADSEEGIEVRMLITDLHSINNQTSGNSYESKQKCSISDSRRRAVV